VGEKVMSKNVVVVGGGSAGWLTALAAKKTYPSLNITVIESKEIGILGAGEGSVPHLVNFFESLDIPVSDLIHNCDATLKNGIKFTNWNNDDGFYYHGFSAVDPSLDISAGISGQASTYPLLAASLVINNRLNEIDFVESICEKNKSPFVLKNKQKTEAVSDYQKVSNFSVHFNATKLANRLKEIGAERGIKVLDNTITQVSLDENDNVSSLTLDNGNKVLCDFVFDCSGFHRFVIGKVFDAKWKSYKDFLPVDSAVPFFLDMTEDIPPYTEAIAMKYGWMWKIPLQSRFGCGYVYDSSLISESEAVKEIEEFLGYEPFYPRKGKGGFKFDAGCYEESWINNCVSIGLSSGFIEPLEATSLWVTIVALNKIFGNPEWITNNVPEIRQEFNTTIYKMNSEIVNFIYFHYMSLRKDTEFWQKFSYENAPKSLREKIDIWQNRLPNRNDSGGYWPFPSWFVVGSGIDIINKSIAKDYIENSEDYKKSIEMYDYYLNYQKYKSSECVDHRQFLEGLK
jgi:tryptophan halogenase